MYLNTVRQMVIGQAQGVLMQDRGVSADQALLLLRLSAHVEGVSLAEVARRLLYATD